MAAININILADRELEAQAQSVLADLGMDMSTAFNAFLTQVVAQKALPLKTMEQWKSDSFDAPMEPVQKSSYLCPPDLTKVPQPGCMRGKIWMADDFDAPMEPVQKSSDLCPPDLTKVPQPGCMRGKIWMADDFDAPMEEFAEYM